MIRKDLLSESYLRLLGLNDRQIVAVRYVKETGKITNGEYQKLGHVSRQSATRDLSDLVVKKVFKMVGLGKKGVHYVIP